MSIQHTLSRGLWILTIFLTACSLPIAPVQGSQVATDMPTLVIPPIATPSEDVQATTPPQPPVTETPVIAPQPTSTQPPVVPPTPTTTPTRAPIPATLPPSSNKTYAVVGIGEGSALDVYQTPDLKSTIVSQLDPATYNFSLTGKEAQAGGQSWVEISLGNQQTGWVQDRNLTEYVAPAAFCQDKSVGVLIEKFKAAVTAKDGQQLAALISPKHGIYVTDLRGGTTINYDLAHAPWVFSSNYAADWGLHPASGLKVSGSFSKVVLPDLLDVLNASYQTTCETVTAGGTTYTATWPKEYQNINFYSLYRPGTPGKEMDWRTWLVGVEYVEGKPYLFALYQLFWEP